jgi:streptogramin lyase
VVTAAAPSGRAPRIPRLCGLHCAGVVTLFDVPTAPNPWGAHGGIASGPDGNLWFTEPGSGRVARVTPAGQVTQFPLPAGAVPWGIASEPDGNLWIADVGGSAIWRMTLSGQLTRFALPKVGSEPLQITAAPDGNLWFTEHTGDRIGRITPAGQITEFAVPTPNAYPEGIVAGPDGNLWFTEVAKIGRITPGGQITEFALPALNSGPSGASGTYGQPAGIATGPDGNLWFTLYDAGMIGRITPSGQVTEFAALDPGDEPADIAAGPDGDLWFTYDIGALIGRITPLGAAAVFSLPSPASEPQPIAAGPDGNMWFGDLLDGEIGHISTGYTGPSLAAPSVSGSGRVGTSQTCDAGQWATWAGQQPVEASWQWLVAGSPLAGATGSSYVPRTSEVGSTLACSETVTYRLLAVTTSATSASIKVLPRFRRRPVRRA